MKTKGVKSTSSSQLRPVVLLLLVAVIVPTVCLLWFMTQAVKNERLAVRQKLIDVYTKKADYCFAEAPDHYFDSLMEHLSSKVDAEPHVVFKIFAENTDDRLQGMLIYDSDGALAYPILETFANQGQDELIEPFQQELKRNFEEAARRYEQIAEQTGSQIIRYKAILSRVRCLEKLDRKQQAVEIAYELSYPPNPNDIEPELAAVVMHCRVFLARLYMKSKDENLYYHLRRILGNSRYNSEKEDPFLLGPAETTAWQLDKLVGMASEAGLSGKLEQEIRIAKARVTAYQSSIEAANIYRTAYYMNDWPEKTIRQLSSKSGLYGLKFKHEDKTVLGISNFDRMFEVVTTAVKDMQDDTVSVNVYNNLGELAFGEENLTGEPFLTLSLGRYLPGFKVAVYFRETDVFKNAASKQTAIYVWTGVLVISLILVSGGVATQTIGRQMKLNRLKNDFIATVTHELKTPLASMRVLVDTVLEGNYTEEKTVTEYLQLISKENERLSRLIENFLTFSRMERNKQAFDIIPVSPVEIANTAAEAIRTKFEKNGVKFDLNVLRPLPMINADKDAIVTVLINLLDNAYKYSYENKQIELNVFKGNGSVCFAVKDNGIGMTRRQTKKVFDRFYQADSSLSRRAEGTGLGLSIVKFIVEAHKGRIDVKSEPDKGTIFTVRLPAERIAQ